jgi:MoaA/NifB/PqqE/SkfB family radical SAM enzyme
LHNRIRRVPDAFETLALGVRQLRRLRPDISVKARCTIQKLNHRFLCDTAASAQELELNGISFLAADVSSTAFNRSSSWSSARQAQVALDASEVQELDAEIQRLIEQSSQHSNPGFIAESPQKLRRIVQHFRACLGQAEATAPRCNAPWVSAVIEASGDVRPCFFHRPLGNTHDRSIHEILNSTEALQFRANLDIATDPICRNCVCSLYVPDSQSIDAKPATGEVQATHGGRS